MHGFDEFFDILYHLNALEEPYQDDYPKNPAFKAIVDGGPLPPHPNMDPKRNQFPDLYLMNERFAGD